MPSNSSKSIWPLPSMSYSFMITFNSSDSSRIPITRNAFINSSSSRYPLLSVSNLLRHQKVCQESCCFSERGVLGEWVVRFDKIMNQCVRKGNVEEETLIPKSILDFSFKRFFCQACIYTKINIEYYWKCAIRGVRATRIEHVCRKRLEISTGKVHCKKVPNFLENCLYI